MTNQVYKRPMPEKKSKKRLLSAFLGLSLLIIIYFGGVYWNHSSGLNDEKLNLAFSVIFITLFFSFLFIENKIHQGSIRINRKNILNIALIFSPLAISVLVYALIKSLFIALGAFIFGQIIFTIYYNNFLPVPGYNKACKFFKKADYKSAKELLDNILTLHPDSYESLILLGAIQLNNMEYSGAIESFEKAKTIDSASITSYINLANAYTAIENHLKAIENSNKVIEIAPDKWINYYTTAINHLFIEDYAQAKEYFKQVLEFTVPPKQMFLVFYGLHKCLNQLDDKASAEIAMDNAIIAGTEQTLNYWESELKKVEEHPNKASSFVYEAIEHIKQAKAIKN